jgi:hypothetical protein
VEALPGTDIAESKHRHRSLLKVEQKDNRSGCSRRTQGVPSMCDYSLHHVASRPAKVGDKLVTTSFTNTITRGFTAAGEPGVAVCLLPGSELAFDDNVVCEPAFAALPKRRTGQKVARFCEVNMDQPAAHHDALEFPNGQIVLLTRLSPGQRATVLQLPATGRIAEDQIARRKAMVE